VSRRIRVGVVGAGWWSNHAHIPALLRNAHAEVVAICDSDTRRATLTAARFGVPLATVEVNGLLDVGVDAVIVATPHDAHYGPAAAALDAGIDVLVEKPMTLDPAQAWDLVRRAREKGARLHVGYTYPYSRHAQQLRAAIDGGELGELSLVSALFSTSVHDLYRGDVESMRRRTGSPVAPSASTYAERARGGGHLYTQLTHAASLLLWSTGCTPQTVTAFEDSEGEAVDAADTISARLDTGVLVAVSGSGMVQNRRPTVEEYRFFGSRGHACLDTAGGRLSFGLATAYREIEALEPPEQMLAGRPSAALVASARDGAPVVVSGELGAWTTELLGAARRSASDGGRPQRCGPGA
jgi:predicted dehydrogenase